MKPRILLHGISLLVLVSTHLFLHAQVEKKYFNADICAGYNVKNYPGFPQQQLPTTVLRIRAGKHYSGAKAWHRNYRYPYAGINVCMASFGNAKVLGYAGAAMFDFILHQKLGARFHLEEGISLGAAIYSKKFDKVNNPTNIVIGSRATAFVSASVSGVWFLKNKNAIVTGFSVFHGSNAHTAIPNVGINVPALHLGYRFGYGKNLEASNVEAMELHQPKWHFSLRVALGINEQGTSTNATDGPKYPIYLSGLYLSKRVGAINKLSFGVEGWYNTGVYAYIESHNEKNKNSHAASMAAQGVVAHEFLFNHFTLLAQGGLYFYNPFYRQQYKDFYNGDLKAQLKTRITAKLGIQYYFKNIFNSEGKQLFVGTYVKTNFGQADFWENGIGFQF